LFIIDYASLLKDAGIKKQLMNVLKKNSSLTESQIEKMYNDKVEYHGENMNKFIHSYIGQYVNLKKENSDIEIDKELDRMVQDFIDLKKQEE
jgi:hypothetical protein